MSLSIDVLERMDRPGYQAFMDNVARWQSSADTKRRAQAEAALRETERLSAPARIKIAFDGKRVTATERRLIEVLDANPGATSEALSRAMGWKGKSWHLHFEAMCRERLSFIVAPPAAAQGGTEDGAALFYADLLAAREEATAAFTLKPEARAALVSAGVLEGAVNG